MAAQDSANQFPFDAPVPTMVPWKTRLTIPLRIKLFFTGVVLPVICLVCVACGADSGGLAPWQSGNLVHHVQVILRAPAIFAFFPLLAISFFSIGVWCFKPGWSNKILIRIGLYTGVLMSLTFVVLLFYTTVLYSQFFAVIAAPTIALVVFVGGKIIRKQFSIAYLMIMTACVAVVLCVMPLVFETRAITGFFFISCLVLVGASPTLGFITFLRASIAANFIDRKIGTENNPGSVTKLLIAPFGWLISYVVSWKVALGIEAVEYAKLPLTDPNCYVSSAAAHGHRRFVQSHRPNQNFGLVNQQMKRVKFLEFALVALAPRLHKTVRSVYNRIGPVLASVCRSSVWFADATFILLKPVEIMAVGVQRILKIDSDLVDRIYVDSESEKNAS